MGPTPESQRSRAGIMHCVPGSGSPAPGMLSGVWALSPEAASGGKYLSVNLIYDNCQFNSSIFVSKQLKAFITVY